MHTFTYGLLHVHMHKKSILHAAAQTVNFVKHVDCRPVPERKHCDSASKSTVTMLTIIRRKNKVALLVLCTCRWNSSNRYRTILYGMFHTCNPRSSICFLRDSISWLDPNPESSSPPPTTIPAEPEESYLAGTCITSQAKINGMQGKRWRRAWEHFELCS